VPGPVLTSLLGTPQSLLAYGQVLGPLNVPPLPDVLPTEPPFDIYCVSVCSLLLTYEGVTTIGDGAQFTTGAPPNLDLEVDSGGTFPTEDAAIFLDVGVTENFTFQFTALWQSLPNNFSDLVNEHSYFGTSAAAGGCVGLFFSKIGIAYTGSVHFDGSNNMVLDTPVVDLPGSNFFVSENEYWTVRIVMNFMSGVVYIYVTLTSELPSIGHQLRYIMPAIPSSSAAVTPPNETLVSVCGTVGNPTYMSLNELCLSSAMLIPSIPPVANAGNDSSLLICSILQLTGSASFDPQGGALTYAWQLIDAPPGSQYIVNVTDGLTYTGVGGFTDKLYSVTLQNINTLSLIPVGTVVVVQGQVYSIIATGSDGYGFFVQVNLFELPDNLSSPTAFTFLYQNGLNTPTSEDPTFYPDVLGIFKFDLIVYNGVLFSFPAEVIANVVENDIARGCTPDLTFLWNYLTDFWNLVECTERVSVMWQGLAQVTAAEMLNLWQVDYSKSLRDIQRTFQRRWMHYDLLMTENPNLVALTTVSAVFGGVESSSIADSGISGVHGTHLDLQVSTLSSPITIYFGPADPYTPAAIQAILQAALAQVDARFVVQLIPNHAGTVARLRIDAPFPFTVLNTSTLPIFTHGQSNGAPTGTAGVAVGTQVYLLDRSAQYLNISMNDFLCIDGVAYRISGVVDVATDPWPFQRVTLLDTLPIPTGATWTISGVATSPDLDFWSGLCEQSDEAVFAVLNVATNQVTLVDGVVLGANETVTGSLPVDATPVGVYLANPAAYSVYLSSVLRRKYIPLDPLIVSVPLLQELIVNTDDSQVLRQNVDYFFTTFRGQPVLSFVTPVPSNAGGPDVWEGQSPPNRMWAETSYLDNRPRIEANFGIPAGFTLDDLAQLPSNIDYLSTVTGLWYAYWNGPTMFNLRAGVQILIGLPFADETGVIVEIRNDFSVSTGLILVEDATNSAVVRSYSYPVSLSLETNPATGLPYAVGDTVQQFAPLVTGAEVLDYIKSPDWFQGYLEQGNFFEVEKFFRFLVRVDSAAFNLAALLFVQSFILRIKPTYTYPLFVVRANVASAEVTVSDEIVPSGFLELYDDTCFPGTEGVATMFDQPDPNGGWRSQFDRNQTPAPPPNISDPAWPDRPTTYPTPTYPIVWGYDKNYLCPEDFILGTLCTTFLAPTLPTYDSLFQFDLPLYTADQASFFTGPTISVPAGPGGLAIGGPYTVPNTGTINSIILQLTGVTAGSPPNYNLVLYKNGTAVSTTPFTCGASGVTLNATISVAVVATDVLTVAILPASGGPIAVAWSTILVETGQAVPWFFDTPVAAGIYCVFHPM
jgi:hypothetical protein